MITCLLLLGTAHLILQTLDSGKISYDELSFDKMPLDKMPFDIMSFGSMLFENNDTK
jgi:hypothetical protein